MIWTEVVGCGVDDHFRGRGADMDKGSGVDDHLRLRRGIIWTKMEWTNLTSWELIVFVTRMGNEPTMPLILEFIKVTLHESFPVVSLIF